MTKPLPCPFCGQADPYTGHLSANELGVWCFHPMRYVGPGRFDGPGCRARVGFSYPNRWPRGLRPRVGTFEADNATLERWCLEQAIQKWNRRVRR